MKLATFQEKDVFPNKNSSNGDGVIYADRITGKAIVFDDEGKVALVGTKVNSFYVLPGGGIDVSELIENGIIRECLEEIGCHINIQDYIGTVEDYRDRDKTHCISYCYTAKLIGEKGKPILTEDEEKNGLRVVWMSLNEAVSVLEKEVEQLKNGEVFFYNTGFNIIRDNVFLKELQKRMQK